ncbi:hypothetical protein DPMN_147894 [Dreissena polymorpha]|uniref:Uncharacterized protein n=1 Tax=Dreissena polymorpha TaxID=45954 RepID=A0A9D4IZQ4_DREPO|nr:hypothetical protein DPMN_147894 [Dreissena polymorpha]
MGLRPETLCRHERCVNTLSPEVNTRLACGILEVARLFASKSWKQPKRIAQIDCVRLQQENQDVQFIDLRNPSVRQYYIRPDNEKND